MLDTTNAVVSAQDYDCWGYLLESRTYQSNNTKYKYTGKERDNENNYDYFGARYYDSRIGRWGGVEPLYDKYVNATPYNYAMLNPIIAVDINGKDAAVTIEGNTIKVDIKIFYSMAEGINQSLNWQQEGKLEEFVNEAQNNWNEAGKNIEYNEQQYNVEFNISMQEVSSMSALTKIQENAEKYESGENFAVSNTKESEIGVKLNVFYLPNFNTVSTIDYSGSHEIGHLLGIEHPVDIYDKSTVMSHNPDRPAPNSSEVKNFLGKLDFTKKNQIVKGVKNARDPIK